MGKILLASILAASLGGAAVTTLGQTFYSSSFQYDFCPGGAFKVTPSPGNVWHWEGDATAAGVNVIVDINGDGVMDTEHPEVRVCITDMQLEAVQNNIPAVHVIDSSGVRWWMLNSVLGQASLTTPIVLPQNSPLTIRLTAANPFDPQATLRVRLIGRVINI